MARKTYKQAQQDLIKALQEAGWEYTSYGVRGTLKVPYITNPSKDLRFWFKAQAVYYTSGRGNITDYKQASSLHLGDIRMEEAKDTIEYLKKAFRNYRVASATPRSAASSYRDDPRWMAARFPGISDDGKPFKKGEEILWWPRTKTVMVGAKAQEAWQRFQSEVEDEDFYNRRASVLDKKKVPRSAINVALDRAGFGGNARFRSVSEALSRAFEVLWDFGIQSDEVIDVWRTKSPKGTLLTSLAWRNEDDSFSPVSIDKNALFINWTELEPNRIEVVGYIS